MTEAPAQPRIAPLPDTEGRVTLNIFRTLRRNEPLSKGFLTLGGHLLGGDVLPPRERELVILRTGWRCGSEYEFGQHTVLGKAAGVTDEEIARLAGGSGEWAPDDAALIALVDELCDDDAVRAQTWERLAARWDDAQMLELLVLAGYYRLVSGMLNSVGVALEPGTPGWPDGSRPARRAPRDGQS